MQLRIRTREYTLEFEGSPEIWNEFLRPLMGGPEAPAASPTGAPSRESRPGGTAPRPATAPTPVAAAPRPSGRPESAPAAPAPRQADDSVPAEVYGRLAALPGRRGQKDAVTAAVWYVTATQDDATPEEVEQHLRDHGFGDVRVKPVMLKHVSRSRMLEPGERRGAVRLTHKGVAYVGSQLLDPSAPSRAGD